jgi:hypothetical protein
MDMGSVLYQAVWLQASFDEVDHRDIDGSTGSLNNVFQTAIPKYISHVCTHNMTNQFGCLALTHIPKDSRG